MPPSPTTNDASGYSQPAAWDYLKSIVAWINNPNTHLHYMGDGQDPGLHANGSITPGEGGVDLGSKYGTPVYALATGPVVAMGSWSGNSSDPSGKDHQVLTQRVNVPGYGPQDVYYQHMYLIPGFKPGQVVQKGQQIGTIGSYNEVEIGFNAGWGGIYGTKHPGPWVSDPRPLLKALVLDQSPSVAPAGSSTFNPLDPSSWVNAILPTFKQWGEYIAIFAIALILIIVGFFLIAGKSIVQASKDGVSGLAKVAV